jgi:hypothetical protein
MCGHMPSVDEHKLKNSGFNLYSIQIATATPKVTPSPIIRSIKEKIVHSFRQATVLHISPQWGQGVKK